MMTVSFDGTLLEAMYTNHRGETRPRKVIPQSLWYGSSLYHDDGPQWFVKATDVEDGRVKDFALTGFRV